MKTLNISAAEEILLIDALATKRDDLLNRLDAKQKAGKWSNEDVLDDMDVDKINGLLDTIMNAVDD